MGRLIRAVMALAILVATMSACGAASPWTGVPPKPSETQKTAAPGPAADAIRQPETGKPPAAAPPAIVVSAKAAAAPRPAAAPTMAPAATTVPQKPGEAGNAQTTGPTHWAVGSAASTDRAWDRMIMRSAQIGIVVPEVEPAIGRLRAIASSAGGYVSASNTRIERYHDNLGAEYERAHATLTLAVRVEAFDAALTSLRALGKVESENGTSQDVTEEYVDHAANLKALYATEGRVLTMLERATTLPDTLMLQKELTGIRSQIERIEGRQRFLQNRSDMSSIAVTLSAPPVVVATPTPVPPATPAPVKRWDPADSAERGFLASLRIVRAIVDLTVLVVAFSWWLVPFGVLGAFLVRRAVRVGPPTRPGSPTPPPVP